MTIKCKGKCERVLPLTTEYFHTHVDNKNGFKGSCRKCVNEKRNNRKAKYPYFYEIEKNGVIKTGKIKGHDKDQVLKIMNIRFFGWDIKKCCTFKYKNQEAVKVRKGNRKK